MHLEGIEISRILSDQINIVEKKNRSEKKMDSSNVSTSGPRTIREGNQRRVKVSL